MVKKGLPIVISAPSGTGKGTVIPYVIKELENAVFSVSCTTREPRAGETDGKSYYFITRDEFEKKIAAGDMLEYNEYVGNLYGTPRREVEEKLNFGTDVIFDVDVNGGMNVKSSLPDAVLIMLMPPDAKTLRGRLHSRGTDSEDVINKRLGMALKEIEFFPRYEYFVVNEDGKAEEAAKKILGIIEAEKRQTVRFPDFIKEFKNI